MSAMTKPLKCPHCAKAIDFGKLTKQNPSESVHSIDGVRAGFILKDIPALIAEHLGDSTADNGGSEYTITLSNLEQTKAITLLFRIEADDDADPTPTIYHRVKGKNGDTASFIVSDSPVVGLEGKVIFGVSKSLDESTT
tara:strand:- start:21 stop:437 length:417 start_codon:yes stop_codon:yes gene_type:complete